MAEISSARPAVAINDPIIVAVGFKPTMLNPAMVIRQ